MTHAAPHHSDHADGGPGSGHGAAGLHVTPHHVVPLPVYFAVFAALLVLLGATLGVTWFDFGHLINVILAMIIASTKAALIALFFMHLRYNGPIIRLAAASGLLLLLIGAAIAVSDYLTREWPISPSAPVLDPRDAPVSVPRTAPAEGPGGERIDVGREGPGARPATDAAR